MPRQTGLMELPADLDSLLGVRDVVVVDGEDAQTYLHSQVSQDLTSLAVGDHTWTFVLEPTGKVEGLARVNKVSDTLFQLDTDAGYGEALLTRINRFKIRVKADTSLAGQVGEAADEQRRVAFGWPRLGVEIVPGSTIPAGTGLTGIAVSFTKGCYPGQELVERMDSRAADAPKSLRRLTVASGAVPGDPVLDGDNEVGTLTSVAGTSAIGWVKRSSEVGDVIEF
jgi:folate-binding protein YgfZ